MVDLVQTVRDIAPRIQFEKIARSILGGAYSLSLVICGDTLAKRINRTHRKKSYSPNVLSFPLSRNEGEIFLNIRKAEREARAFRTSSAERITFLFIHACLHLKGFDHGKKMEQYEQSYLKKAGF